MALVTKLCDALQFLLGKHFSKTTFFKSWITKYKMVIVNSYFKLYAYFKPLVLDAFRW